MTKILLMRHAEGLHQLSPEIIAGSSPDVELTAEGVDDARRSSRMIVEEFGLTQNMDRIPFEVFSSPYKRAMQTARWLIEGLNSSGHSYKSPEDIRVIDELKELSQGCWEGKPRKEMYTDEVYKLIAEKDIFFAPSNGESVYKATERMIAALGALAEHAVISGGATPLAVTHNMAIKSLLGAIYGWDRDRIRAYNIPNLGLLRFGYEQASEESSLIVIKHESQVSLEDF